MCPVATLKIKNRIGIIPVDTISSSNAVSSEMYSTTSLSNTTILFFGLPRVGARGGLLAMSLKTCRMTAELLSALAAAP